jgi:Flp pilus assembly protein TadG
VTGGASGRERGSVAIWLLGVCVMLLFLGGLSLDLWRAFAERRGLAAAADAAAVAAVQAVDADRFRATGEIVLDPALAETFALASLASQPEAARMTGAVVEAAPERVTVTVTGELPLTLLAILVPDRAPLRISVRSTATPGTGPDP